MKYQPPGTTPSSGEDLRAWFRDELQHIADALSELETDTILLKEWNAEPDKLYNGLVAYADGTNWNPGGGRGVYAYENGAWVKLSN